MTREKILTFEVNYNSTTQVLLYALKYQNLITDKELINYIQVYFMILTYGEVSEVVSLQKNLTDHISRLILDFMKRDISIFQSLVNSFIEFLGGKKLFLF
jgi:hypothetical protein